MHMLRCSFAKAILEAYVKHIPLMSFIAVALSMPAIADTDKGQTSPTVSQDAPEPWQPEDGDVILFNVFRQGDKEFGTHRVSFEVESDGNFTATSDVDLKAGFGPITVFRYSLNATESWEDGQLVELQGSTNDDGDKKSVNASFQNGQLQVDGSGYTGEAPAGIIPSSHWNMLQAFSTKILSTESGEILETDVSKIGEETLQINGRSIPSVHYRLKSDLTVDLWYDDQGRWVQLSFEARGQQIDYRLAQLY